jgi:GntR family histidine utilization transcriptional repressor
VSGQPGSLNETIRGEIAGRILSGEWPPGHRIPVEHELMAAYGCSRMTVNKVLTALAAEGLIERRRRAGSFVGRQRSQSAVLDIPDVRAEVKALGLPWRMEILARAVRRATAADRARLGDGAGSRVLSLTCRHFAGARVHALEERLVDLSAVPAAEAASFDGVPPGAWLLSHVPWSQAEHRIAAVPADDAKARLLGVPVGTACLQVDRRTWRSGRPVTAVRMTHPGDGYSLVARFAPGA